MISKHIRNLTEAKQHIKRLLNLLEEIDQGGVHLYASEREDIQYVKNFLNKLEESYGSIEGGFKVNCKRGEA